MTISATVRESGEYLVSATISADRLIDVRPRNDRSSVTARVLAPEIVVSKARVGKPTAHGDGSYKLRYDIELRNPGKVALTNLQVTNALTGAFAAAEDFAVIGVEGGFTLNPDFDGVRDANLLAGTDTLAAGQRGNIILEVSVTPGDNLGPYVGRVVVEAESGLGIGVESSAEFSQVTFRADPALRAGTTTPLD